uniref:Ig-like domain-containing protein n=1 Tax=Oreochromis aureus TaxID=47969 RepID=A0AAZ1XND4_OREAU
MTIDQRLLIKDTDSRMAMSTIHRELGNGCNHSIKNITAESGQKNVTLPCRAPNNNTIIIVEWSRAGLGDEYVLFYQNGHFPSDYQHPPFKNRVDLQDRQMKDGDVSLILKNVTINDTGTYECRVQNEVDSMTGWICCTDHCSLSFWLILMFFLFRHFFVALVLCFGWTHPRPSYCVLAEGRSFYSILSTSSSMDSEDFFLLTSSLAQLLSLASSDHGTFS